MSLSSARRRVSSLSGLLAGALLLGGCAAATSGSGPPPPAPTSVADLDPGSMVVPRIDFCDLVAEDDVTAALGATPDVAAERAPGDPVGPEDPDAQPVQEIGCSWSSGTTSARAWLFARPVGDDLARSAVEEAERQRGCRTAPASYGAPSVRQQCAVEGQQRTRYAGRFGDTWLTCELEAPRLRAARAEAWCVSVANALEADS